VKSSLRYCSTLYKLKELFDNTDLDIDGQNYSPWFTTFKSLCMITMSKEWRISCLFNTALQNSIVILIEVPWGNINADVHCFRCLRWLMSLQEWYISASFFLSKNDRNISCVAIKHTLSPNRHALHSMLTNALIELSEQKVKVLSQNSVRNKNARFDCQCFQFHHHAGQVECNVTLSY